MINFYSNIKRTLSFLHLNRLLLLISDENNQKVLGSHVGYTIYFKGNRMSPPPPAIELCVPK